MKILAADQEAALVDRMAKASPMSAHGLHRDVIIGFVSPPKNPCEVPAGEANGLRHVTLVAQAGSMRSPIRPLVDIDREFDAAVVSVGTGRSAQKRPSWCALSDKPPG